MRGLEEAHRRTKQSSLYMAGLFTVHQIVIMLIGPAVGRWADDKGRKPILVFGFLFFSLRALWFAFA